MHIGTSPQRPVTVRVFSQRLSATRRGARLARLLAVRQLDVWGVPYGSRLSEAAASVVAELTANAVLHGRVPGRDFLLALALGGDVLRVEVTDTRADRRPASRPRAPGPDDESGRGLLLVEALATCWGVAGEAPPRKTVWAELDASS
ncbi:ATP-binding protein [Streptomyces sp. JJ36]|uniref:ATP-binding protein n=1 Tax=Streptomyces sp. JJ36 TaxID=2736645 RepID=UPI001F3F98F0|nr:ATP-binding protein [Streptomyces sp. JJ36]MCF6521538.1 ATP-binding protein [Streptomyces sp. JJ36]